MNRYAANIRVLIVDDSAVVRQLLTVVLQSDPRIEVVGVAADPFVARSRIRELDPDVITLDVEMPRMDGLTFLRNLMRLRPTPVVMFSSLTARGAAASLEALAIGAVDVLAKPGGDPAGGIEAMAEQLIEKVKAAAGANRRAMERIASGVRANRGGIPSAATVPAPRTAGSCVVAIGASTGGTEAIKEVLLGLPGTAPVLIAQHIPPGFSTAFAKRLDGLCALNVTEAQGGERLQPGEVYIAPGGRHLILDADREGYVCRVQDTDPVNRHRPSVDVLFRSVAQTAGPRSVAALLTGMGDDGARGLKVLREAGAQTLVQDEATSVVWGMPGRAYELGAAGQVVALPRMAAAIAAAVSGCLPQRARVRAVPDE